MGERAAILILALLGACGADRLHPEADVQDEHVSSEAAVPDAPVPETPPDAPEPVVEEPNVCDLIEALAGDCSNYGYDCPAYPEAQSWCLLAVLESLDNVCAFFVEQPVCEGAAVSWYGAADCELQECFGLTRADACVANYDALCDFLY